MSSGWSFFFLSRLARSEFSKLSIVGKMSCLCVLPPLSSPFFFATCLFHLASSLLLRSVALRFSSCHPLLYLSRRLLPTLLLPPAFSLAARLIHCIVCSLQVYPRKSTPAVDRLCVGVPAAEVSQMLLDHTGGETFQTEKKFLDFFYLLIFLVQNISGEAFYFILVYFGLFFC